MADFSALKSTIQTYIKQNGNEEITGSILQEILLAMVQTMGDSAINGLVSSLSNEATTRANADTTLSNGITAINNAIQNGYVYAGIATPTGTPASGKVFYVAIQAGTYTNFGGLTVAYGINILKYNGSAWSLDVIMGIEAEPTPGSDNLVKSGGIANKLLNNFFVGQGQIYSATRIDGIAPGTKVRVFTFAQTWECNNRYGYIFDIESYNGTSYTVLGGTATGHDEPFPIIPPYYDVTIPADSQYIIVGGRAEAGVKVKFIIALLSTTFKSGEFPKDISLDKIISQSDVNLPTSKAVGKQLLNSYFICNGDNDFSGIDIQAAPGNTYRVCMCEDWDASRYTGGYTKLSMGYYNQNNQYVQVFGRYIQDWSLPAYVDVTIPSDAKPLIRIQGRGNANEVVKFMVVNISAVLQGNIPYQILSKADKNRLSYRRGRFKNNGDLTEISRDDDYAGWYISDMFLPVSVGSKVTWNFGAYSPGSSACCLIIYNNNKEYVDYYGSNNGEGTRNITIPSGVAYIRISFYKTFNEKPNTIPVTVDGIDYFIDDISKLNNHDAILFPTVSDFGVIGDSYPEEVVEIEKYLKYKRTTNFNRLHFLHVSDNHNGDFGNAQSFLDYCPAQFLINTGDMVNDKFADGAANTIALSIAPTKPVYLVLGNHDVSYATSNQAVFDTFYGNSETDGTVNHHNSVAGGVVAEHTYYKVDFATEKVKCIMLDMNDGWSDAELSDLGPSPATLGKMSQTQINWFVTQLQDAITNGYHVCVFIHTLPYNVDMKERILNFCDVGSNAGLGVNSALTFLPNIIDAFISGSSVSFDYHGNNYSFTFASAGHFIAWFCGHTHYDMGGWMEAHTNQFMINVCQPFNNTGAAADLGSYDEDKLGVHFNFYTIDTNVNSLTVYRVGQQKTIYATDRKCYRINYK